MTSYMTNECFNASTASYPSASYGYNYAASGINNSISTRSGMDKEKLAQVKSEIRSLKGMFLTR